MRTSISLLLLIVSSLGMRGVAAASGPGSVDRSFGTNGLAGAAAPVGAAAAAIAAGPDGRLVVAGSALDAAGNDAFAVARYDAEGELDTTFGAGGIVVLQLGAPSAAGFRTLSRAAAVAVEADGGVVVAGNARTSEGDREGAAVAVARLDRSGGLRWSVVHQLGVPRLRWARFSEATAVLLQPDGQVVVAGDTVTAEFAGTELLVARLNGADGSLDRSFAGSGSVIDPTPRGDPGSACGWGNVTGSSLAVTPSGAILAAGELARRCGVAGSSPIAILRAYSPSGLRDPVFASDPPSLGSIGQIATAADGSILAFGLLGNTVSIPGFARYTPTGALDTSFAAPDGIVPVPRPGRDPGYVRGFAHQRDGRLVGAFVNFSTSGVVRMLPDGTADRSFGAWGSAPLGIRSPTGLSLQPDGSIVVVGRGADATGDLTPGFLLQRLLGGTAHSRVLVGSDVRIRRRAAIVRLACRRSGRAADCSGIVSIRPRLARRPRLGSAPYRLAGGARRTVRVHLTARARKRIAAGRRVVLVQASNENAPRTQRRIRLRVHHGRGSSVATAPPY